MKDTDVRIPMSARRLLFRGLFGLVCSALISFLIANNYSTWVAFAVFLALSLVLFVVLFVLQNALYQRPLAALAAKVGPLSPGQALDIPDEFAKIEQSLSLVAQNLNARSREVSELAERLQSIFDATEEAIIAIRAPNELLAANTAAYRLFELPRAAAPTAESFFFKAPPIIVIIEKCLKEGYAFLEQFSMLKEKKEVILTVGESGSGSGIPTVSSS